MRIPRLALKTLTLLAFATLSTLALADDGDAPAQVGRIALTQGQVSIGGEVGAEMTPAQVNWPVTSGAAISTARGARTELRIGSTSIRLDGDSSLDVTQLDDANLRLRLNYGSVSVRVQNPDALAGFELVTPQARVRLQQPGRVRVDAERVRDTSAVAVFDGAALVDGGGSELTLRAGKRAELGDDDVRTLLAQRDEFDDWSAARDRTADSATSARYVGSDMTGYEDLDRYGDWRVDSDYGPLWTPVVASDWVPYRDGSWVWLDPWGWTWVDNSPWGYAPFHYGRWVYTHHRWAWAPGRHHEHPVWAPALVGWVGGAGVNLTFRDHNRRPASGWYPLTPHDRFVPGYRASESHVRRMNDDVHPDSHRPRDFRPQGLTVVPQDRFTRPGRVNVAHTPGVNAAPLAAGNALATASAAPPPPPDRAQHSGRFVRDQGLERGRGGEPGFHHGPVSNIDSRLQRDGLLRAPTVVTVPPVAAPAQGVTSPTPHLPPQAQAIVSPTPHLPPQALGIDSPTPHPMGRAPITAGPALEPGAGWQRAERREQQDEFRHARQRIEAPAPAPSAARPMPAPVQLQAAPPPAAMPAPQPAARPASAPAQHGGEERHARNEQRGERDR